MENKRTFKFACVFCGSRSGNVPAYKEGAEALGRELLARRVGLVYGGGTIGLMGVISNTIHAGGGKVIGVIPTALTQKETCGAMLGEVTYVDSMHERKELMYKKADCFIACPGGYGTLDELLEICTWAQLGIHSKPIGLLNINGYFDGLVAWRATAVAGGFLSKHDEELLIVDSDPASLLDKLEQFPKREPYFDWKIKV